MSYPSRETTVTLLAALLLSFSAWTWGGVVLWAQWFVAALGLLTLAVALLPDLRSDESHGNFLPSTLGLSLGLGLLVAAALIWSDLSLLLAQRDGFRQLFPAAEPEPLRFAQWGLRGLLAGVFTSLASLIAAGCLRPSEPRRRLFRSGHESQQRAQLPPRECALPAVAVRILQDPASQCL